LPVARAVGGHPRMTMKNTSKPMADRRGEFGFIVRYLFLGL
jgi:hypothetical protein